MLSLKVLQSEMRRVLGRNQTVVALATNVARETAVSRVYVRRHAALIRPWLDSPVFLLHVPKCAGVSIARALGRPDPGHVLVGDHEPHVRRRLQGGLAVACVRDPVSRLESTFRYSRQLHEDVGLNYISNVARFDSVTDFVEYNLDRGAFDRNYFLRPASHFIQSAISNEMEVAVFGIEQVAAGLTEVAETIGISLHPIESLNRSTGSGDGRDVLDPSLQREVRRAYEADAELHQRSQNGVVWLR